MKKITMLLVVMLFGMATAFAQVYNVNVSWTLGICDCLGTDQDNYFRVSISIFDDANEEWVVVDKTKNTANATILNINIPVSEVQTYCGQIHQETPSFTVYAEVWYMETSTGQSCCSGTGDEGPYSCQDFYNGGTNVFGITVP